MNETVRVLCERASGENDPAKLLKLVSEINRLMREEETYKSGQYAQPLAAEPEVSE